MTNPMAFAGDPLGFIDSLLIPSGHGPRRFGDVMAAFQRADFQAMVPALLALAAGEQPKPGRFWIERTKGASKDSDLACCLLWLLAFSPRPLVVQVGAADQSQADELRKAARDISRMNGWLGEVLAVQALSIVNATTGSRADIIAADAMGSHGARPDLLILNELSHVGRREFAETLLDNASKMPRGVVVIATNAGHLDTWQAEWRATARQSDRWHFSAFTEPAPWLDPAEIAEARRRNPPLRFARLWAGQWVSDSGDALSAADVDAAVDSSLVEITRPERGWAYHVGADLGLSRDHAAVCVVGRHVGEVRYLRQKVAMHPTIAHAVDLGLMRRPRGRRRIVRTRGDGSYRVAVAKSWKPAGGKIDLSRVERAIRVLSARFSAPVLIDAWQAASMAQAMERDGIDCQLVTFTPSVLGEIAQVVLTAFADRTIRLPALPGLVAQLRALRAEERTFGTRLVSPRTASGGHGDLCSALELALLGASRSDVPAGEEDYHRGEIKRYAEEHGYRIVRWYEDDGISGDATEKRLGFLAMQRAAANGRDFDVVLCWDQDRFGRFDSLEAGHWIHPFRKAGVRLETVTEGKINWNDFTGRVMYGLKQEGKHQFLIDLSRNTARGQVTNARRGFLCGQAAPYGYDRILVDEAGQPKQRVRNGEQFAKPRSWHVSLVPSDDPEQVKTVRWLFDQYATTDIGIRSLVDDLNRRGVPSPRGGQWYMGTIRMILRNEAYVGTFTWAKRRLGKYHRVAAGEVKARDDGGRVGMNPREEHIVVPGAHLALIDAETFAAVQDRLAERKHRPASHKRTNGDRYLLSGVVFCGHCGRKMHGSVKTRRKGGKVYVWEKYVCSTYVMKGRACGCGYHTVDQGELLAYVLKAVRELCFAGGNRDALTEDVREFVSQGQSVDPAEVDALRAKVADLDREVGHGTRRLLRAPDDVADLLAGELSGLRRERDRLAAQLTALERPAAAVDVAAEADQIVDSLWRLAEELQSDIPGARLREIIRSLVFRIDLYFDHVPRGTRIECPLAKGTMHFRQDENLFFLENRGDWI